MLPATMNGMRRFEMANGHSDYARCVPGALRRDGEMKITIQRGGIVAGAQRSVLPGEERLPERRARSRRQWLTAFLWLLCVIIAFLCYLRLAGTRAVDSDGAAQALQAWDMLHGNLLLRGWTLSDVSFYTTELPQYMVVELVRGLGAHVVDVAAAMTFTLVLLLSALLAKGTATGASAVARVLITTGIMVAPEPSAGVKIFISSPDHFGTTVPVLLTWLILDRAPRRWFVPVVAAGLLGWAAVADTLVLFIGVLPVALVCAARISRAVVAQRVPLRSLWYEIMLGVGALVAAALAEVTVRVIRALGGFVVAAIVVNLAAYVFSTQSGSILASREIVAVLPFSAVLAGRMLADRVLALRWAPTVLLVLLAGYLGGLGYALAQPSAQPTGQQLTSWLAAHNLRSGLAGYWQSNAVTLVSGDRIRVRQITAAGARVVPYHWESSSRWYDPRQVSANFVVLTGGTAEYPGFDDEAA